MQLERPFLYYVVNHVPNVLGVAAVVYAVVLFTALTT